MESKDERPWVEQGMMEIIVRWRKPGASAWSIEENKCKLDMGAASLAKPGFIRLVGDTVAAMVSKALNK